MTTFWQTTLRAIQTRTCLTCGSHEATPYKGTTIPYCDNCKREHARRRRKDKDE